MAYCNVVMGSLKNLYSHVCNKRWLFNPPRMRRRVTVVVLSVCLSVNSHLTSGASVHSVTYSTGNRGQNICGVFSETALL